MSIIGRVEEQNKLKTILMSERPEFVVLYGRRRIGKTFLIKEYFQNKFSFYTTGVLSKNNRTELLAFNKSLLDYGSNEKAAPNNWFEAFDRLEKMITNNTIKLDPRYNKRILFIDELPWFDTGKSEFKAAFELFWNSFASTQNDLVLIVCGSATSWILNNLLNGEGGFHNRITAKIPLHPFSIKEAEQLINEQNKNDLSRHDIINAYMVFGGVPYYLNLIDSNFSLIQNIDNICFKEGGELSNEFKNLFSSLFKRHENHSKIINVLSKTKKGMSRTELIKETKLPSGSSFTKVLLELEECGFIRKYRDYKKYTKDGLYQLIDPFTLFSINYLKNRKFDLWSNFIGSTTYYSWCGYAFEILCINHINSIKHALMIEGIDSLNYSYFNNKDEGAQIDLLIDRKDNVINLCEIKYSLQEYSINKEYAEKLINKIDTFKADTRTRKSIQLTFITLNGLKKNNYSGMVRKELTSDIFFE